jgi:D-xylose transport system substrate-binding protein
LYSVSKRVGLTAVAGSAALILAACGSSGGGSAAPSSGSTGSSSAASAPSISATDFTNDFSAMAKLKPLAAQGKGGVGVILPDTTTSARYTEFDAPYLTKALETAGLTSSQFSVQNAQGSDATQLSLAQADITKGDSVLIMDPLDSGVGKSIEKYAAAHGAVVIDYDRLTLGGSRKYYVSFDNVKVGTLIGNGWSAASRTGRSRTRTCWSCAATRPTTTRPCSPRATTRCWPRTSAPAGRTSARPPAPGTRRPR